nr:uncharacterized mitochondrial protein AtMg00810-like [Tanacetum cinerariifolium]
MVATAVLTQSKLVSITAVRPVSVVVPKIKVTRPRLAKPSVTKSKSPIRRHLTRSHSLKTSNSPPRVTVIQALVGNPQYALKDKGVIDSGCSRHMTGNMSYLSDFEELNGGYVAFGDDYSRFTWVFFLATKDETSPILKTFIIGLENQLSLEVKVIRSDNGTELKNNDLKEFCGMKGIKREFNSLRKFEGKVDEGFLVGYSVNSKAFRVFNNRTRIVQETLHANLLENKPNVAGSGPTWLFDINSLTRTMNYQPVTLGNQANPSVGFQDKFDAEKAGKEINQQYMIFPVWSSGSTNPQNNNGDVIFDGKEHHFDAKKPESEVTLSLSRYRDLSAEFEDCFDNSHNEVNAAGTIVPTVGQNSLNSTNTFSVLGPSNDVVSPKYRKSSFIDASQLYDDLDMPELEDIIYSDNDNDIGAEADFNNLETSITVSPIPTARVHKDHLVSQIIGDLSSTTQTRNMTRVVKDQDDIIFGATNKYLCKSFEKLMKDKFQTSSMRELTFFLGLQVKQKKDRIFISQDKYVAKILRKFGLTKGKSASTPIDSKKPLLKDSDGEDIDVHTYRSMIGSLMYLTSSRPDIMFPKCACVRFQVTPKASHLHAVKRIFRYLKDKPHLGLWYPKDSPFVLVAYSDNDYAGASLDIKSTTGGCQFLRCRLISWQCKKQTVVATSSTEAEYVAATSCCAQVLWIQNQLLDYSPKQMALGKDKSNPLMADNLLKNVWFSTHHVTLNEELASPKANGSWANGNW